MEAIIPHVTNETDQLQVVVLGLPQSRGYVPKLSETYDAKSYEAVSRGIYPRESDVIREMNVVLSILQRYGVEVLRPTPLENYNQIFARDVGFTIDDTFFISNLIPDRALETDAFATSILPRIAEGHIEHLPEQVHTEGGDILLYDDLLFVGTYLGDDYPDLKTARTNRYAIDFLRERFPRKRVIPLELRKHDHDPHRSVLHLDCAFQPVSRGRALIYKEGFLHKQDIGLLEEIFGHDNPSSATSTSSASTNTCARLGG